MKKRKGKKRAQDDDADGTSNGKGTLEQRRKLRGELRTNLDVLRKDKTELIRGDKTARERTMAARKAQDVLFKQVRESWAERNGCQVFSPLILFIQVNHTREFVLDAEAGLLLGKIVAEQALNVDVALSSDTPGEFVGKVQAWLSRQPSADTGNDVEDEIAKWSALGRMAAKHHPMCPGASFLYGSIPTVPVVRAQRKAKGPEDNVEKKKQVKEMEEEADPQAQNLATMRQVDGLQTYLYNMGDYPVWKLVANPKSMAQTVEHMFHLSFLVKEGKAKVSVDKQQGMMVKPAKPPGPGAEDNLERIQAIVRLDKAQLDAVISRYKISQPAIMHRAPATPADNAQAEAASVTGSGPGTAASKKRASAAAPVTPASAIAPTQIVDSVSATTPIAGKRRKKLD